MITVTKGKVARTFPDTLLPQICLELAGGGYTAGQTAKAMRLQSDVLDKGRAKLGATTVEKSDEKP